MELIKDVIRYLLGGMIENLAEWKVSEKRRTYFHHREGKKENSVAMFPGFWL